MKEKLDLIRAIMKKDNQANVEKLFNIYLDAFAMDRHPSEDDLMDYGRTYSMYINYLGQESAVVRKMESQEDIKRNIEVEKDIERDYFEHSQGDLPK
jgi:hypothetical protein